MQNMQSVLIIVILITASDGCSRPRYQRDQAVPLRGSGVGSFTKHSRGICKCASILLCHGRGITTSPLFPGVYNARLVDLQIPIYFARAVNNAMIRDIQLTKDNVKQFADGIDNACWLELALGDQHMFVSAGILEGGKPLVYTHMDITISRNSNSEIIDAKISPAKPMPLVEGSMLHVTYSVAWPTPLA